MRSGLLLFYSSVSNICIASCVLSGEEVFEMNEEEFTESGGLVGYIERARSLLVRKKYKPAMR